MPLTHIHHNYQYIKTFTTNTLTSTSTSTSNTWRIKAQQSQLISQISSILLQRTNWQTLLKPLNLSHKLTPQIFLKILNKTQQNSTISLDFFNWAKSNLVGFQPDLKIHSKIVQILIGSGQKAHQIKPILGSFIGSYPSTHVVFHVIQACNDKKLESFACSLIIECYAQKGFYFDGLNVYRTSLLNGFLPKVCSLNALLDVLDQFCEFKLGYCLYGSMIRNGVVPNLSIWSVMSSIMCKNGKFDNVVKLLGSCDGNYAMFDMVIDCYSRIGNFEGAIGLVNEMCKRNLEPGFRTYGSILDGACKFLDDNVVDMMLCAMWEKKLLPHDLAYQHNNNNSNNSPICLTEVTSGEGEMYTTLSPSSRDLSYGYDDVIMKFCDHGMSYAAALLFDKARNGGFLLDYKTFGCMLEAYCKGGRVEQAIGLYKIISKEKVVIKKSCYLEFAECLCSGTPSENVNQVLICLIMKGFSPSVSGISKFMMKLGGKENWKEAKKLLNVMLQANLLPDSGCCRVLVKHYCSSGQIDSALLLHQTMEKTKTLWDVTTYNILLRNLLIVGRVNEAFNIFESMRRNNVVNRASFVVMISGLSQVKDMKKAMQVHDDMVKMGLKPSSKTYKSLISVFR